MKQIVNLAEVALTPVGDGAKFDAVCASTGGQIGGRKLGVSLCEVQPGKRAVPNHAHHVNEEMIFVLEGSGTYD